MPFTLLMTHFSIPDVGEMDKLIIKVSVPFPVQFYVVCTRCKCNLKNEQISVDTNLNPALFPPYFTISRRGNTFWVDGPEAG